MLSEAKDRISGDGAGFLHDGMGREDNKHIKEVRNPRVIETGYRSPQLTLWYAPSETKRRAVARPMPLLPPVMTATFPSSLVKMFLLSGEHVIA
jgi:hypothetical protein